MKKSNLNKWLLFSWKKLLIVIASWFAAVLIHNLFYAIFGFEEAFFFILAVFILPIYFLVMVLYNLIRKILK